MVVSHDPPVTKLSLGSQAMSGAAWSFEAAADKAMRATCSGEPSGVTMASPRPVASAPTTAAATRARSRWRAHQRLAVQRATPAPAATSR